MAEIFLNILLCAETIERCFLHSHTKNSLCSEPVLSAPKELMNSFFIVELKSGIENTVRQSPTQAVIWGV